MVDLRSLTVLVVKKGNEYLVGMGCVLRWSVSVYDAWQTRKMEDARKVARKVGGTVMLFNPAVNQIREVKG